MADEMVEEYMSSLKDLTINSKPFISMLTMLAEENSKYAPAIVQAIESHIEKVSSDVKLPILYLIDSIIKNVSSVYVPLFTNNIVQIFASAFEKVDEKTRMSMFKLRQTWNDIFPPKKLYTLDLRIQHIDQNWPVSPHAPTSIHVNPKFLNRNVTSSDAVKEATPPISGTSILSSDHEATILKKQQILQELQQQKRDLELLQQKVLYGDALPQAIVRPVVQEEPSALPNPVNRHIAVPKQTPRGVVIPAKPFPVPANHTAVPKPKIPPVNSSLVHASRPRDPRLARMQAAKKPEVPKTNESEKKAPTKYKPTDDPVEEILRKQKSSSLKALPKKLEKAEKEIPEAKITEDQIQQRQMAMLKAPVLGQINRKSEVEKSQRKRQCSPAKKIVRDRHESPKRSDKDSPSKSRSSRDSKPKKKSRDKSSRSDSKSEENKPGRVRVKNDENSEKDEKIIPEVTLDSSPTTDSRVQDPRVNKEKDQPIVIGSPEPPPPPTIGPQTNTEIEVTEIAPKEERVGFKAVKALKSRNYSRRNKERSLTPPPAPPKEEEASVRKVLNAPEEIVDVGKDVDLRQLVVGNKKRTSTDGDIDGPPCKRGKEDDAIQLFGNKDMDERLPPGGIRTPPPPVISDASSINSPSSPREMRSDAEGEVQMDTSEPKDEPLLEKERLIRSLNRSGNEADNAKKLDDFIITAKEQLKRGIITPAEYNLYMQKVVQTTEDEKIKIAQKRRNSFIKTDESGGYERNFRPNFPVSDFRPQGPWRSEEDGPPFGRKRRGRGGFGPRGRMHNEPHWRDRDHRYKQGGGSPDWMDQDSRSQEPWMNMGDITIPPSDPKMVEAASDPVRNISIDGHPRAIRFYGNTAVVMLSFSDARQISFENGVRRVFIAGFDVLCQLNGPPMQFYFQQEQHTVRLGAPTRELYVNERYYEVQFGGPMIHTNLAGVPCTIQLEGPPPQVRIAPHRTNLCLGSVLLIVDARSSFTIYLDAKPQRFLINGRPLVLRFSKQLSLTLINDVPVPLIFGGSPVPINFLDRQHFLRLTELPLGIMPGRVNIRGMDMELEGSPHYQDNNSAEMPILQEPNVPTIPPAIDSQRGVYMDLVSSMMGGSSEVEEKVGFNYKSEADTESVIAQPAPISIPGTQGEAPAAGLPILQNLNITDLFQSLVASGIIPKQKEPTPPPPAVNDTPQETNLPVLKPLRFDDPNSLKTKRPGAHLRLYSGIQCGSCGIRFHPNDTQKYSQHLDWHFRQNRRGRDALRHGSCRRWYYEIKDWKEFNEIEESEDRAQSWFETEAQNQGNDAVEEEQPSEPAPRGSGPVMCHICHDRFDTFFHEETEEWHLKNCISADGRFYHPICHKDAMEISENEPITAPPLLEPLREERPKMEDSVVVLDLDDDDPDDGMDEIEVVTADDGDIRNVVNQLVERVIMEEECDATPIEDDELEVLAVTNTAENREPIAYIEIEDNGDDDDYTPEDTVLLFDPNKKIKAEPLDEMELPVSQVDQTLTNVISSIDGNIELSEAPVATTSVPSKIKITFTRPTPVLVAPEPINDLVAEPIDPNELQIEEIVSEPLPIKPKKPRIAEKSMKEYPPCLRGTEMSGLCNIM